MIIKEDFDIIDYNSFHVHCVAKYFLEVDSIKDFDEVKNLKIYKKYLEENKIIILGGGSNSLFTSDYDGLVIKISTKGKEILEKNDEFTFVKIAAGEVRDEFVKRSIGENLKGLENLILIPGSVGASCVGNIGAYGKEVAQLIDHVICIDRVTFEQKMFNNKVCEFGYRDSIFKNEFKGKFFIKEVVFKLSSSDNYKINAEYKDVLEFLGNNGIKKEYATYKDIANAVESIRTKKLPNIDVIGNAGSFFVNPIIDLEQYEKASIMWKENKLYNGKDIGKFDLGNNKVKLFAGQLLDFAGFKEIEENGVAVWKDQALVIINKSGKASGNDIVHFSKKIQNTVKEIFGVALEAEVNFI